MASAFRVWGIGSRGVPRPSLADYVRRPEGAPGGRPRPEGVYVGYLLPAVHEVHWLTGTGAMAV